MSVYSKLDGTGPVSNASSGVWKIQKKRKTGERQHRDEKKKQRGKEEQEGNENPPVDETMDKVDVKSLDNEEQIGYGSVKKKNKTPRKIDLTI
jgi:hypothetical protein